MQENFFSLFSFHKIADNYFQGLIQVEFLIILGGLMKSWKREFIRKKVKPQKRWFLFGFYLCFLLSIKAIERL
jgi:hypothetical protein